MRARCTLLAVLNLVLAFSAGAQQPDDPYRLRFDPPALELQVGGEAAFTVTMLRHGAAEATPPTRFLCRVEPAEHASVRLVDQRFVFTATRAGRYTILVEHDSGRAWFGARGELLAVVSEVRPVVARLAIWPDGSERELGPNDAIELRPGAAVRLRAALVDELGRLLGGGEGLRWTSSSPALRALPQVGGGVELLLARDAQPGELAVWVELPGSELRRTVVCRVPGHGHGDQPPVEGQRIVVIDLDSGRDLPEAIHVQPGATLRLRARWMVAAGQFERSEFRWRLEPAEAGIVRGGLDDDVRIDLAAGLSHGSRVVLTVSAGRRMQTSVTMIVGEPQGHQRPDRIVIVDAAGRDLGEGIQAWPAGATVKLSVILLDRAGRMLEGGEIRWALSDPRAARLRELDARSVELALPVGYRQVAGLEAVLVGTTLRATVRWQLGEPQPVPQPGAITVFGPDGAQVGERLQLMAGARLELTARVLDRFGRPSPQPVTWTLDDPRGGTFAPNPAASTVFSAGRPGRYVMTVAAATASLAIAVEIDRGGPAPRLAGIRMRMVGARGAMPVEHGQVLWLPRGQTVVLEVVGVAADGREVAVQVRWSSSRHVELMPSGDRAPASAAVRPLAGGGGRVRAEVEGTPFVVEVILLAP